MAAYCDRAYLAKYLPAKLLNAVPVTEQDSYLEARSRYADTYFRTRYTVPLTDTTEEVKLCIALLAVYDCLCLIGFNPDSEADQVVQGRYKEQIAWLKDVARGLATPTVNTANDEADAIPETDSEPVRGW